MAQQVANGALLSCSFGTTPSTLTVLPSNRVNATSLPAGTVIDQKPMVNIMPFGMCTTVSNPQVAAATSAASGVLTPQPCIPNTSAPWMPGSPTVRICGQSALNNTCQLMCMWGGTIIVNNAGQQTVNVP